MRVTLQVNRTKLGQETGVPLPTIAHPGEDIAYDVYMPFDMYVIEAHKVARIPLGIAVRLVGSKRREYPPRTPGGAVAVTYEEVPYGAVLRSRSSLASQGLFVVGGEIDAGYRGELAVLIYNSSDEEVVLGHHQKIAQIRPVSLHAAFVTEVDELPSSARGTGGFGSTGK